METLILFAVWENDSGFVCNFEMHCVYEKLLSSHDEISALYNQIQLRHASGKFNTFSMIPLIVYRQPT